jgi:hypothetical protein
MLSLAEKQKKGARIVRQLPALARAEGGKVRLAHLISKAREDLKSGSMAMT